jgi:hypothetical protein
MQVCWRLDACATDNEAVRMPENLPLALVIVGAILLLIALLGGQFKLFGAEVPGTVGRASRWMSGLAGVILLAAGVYVGSGVMKPLPSTEPPSTQPPPAQPRSAQPAHQPPEIRPPARASNPDALFIDTANWPRTGDGRLRDPRVRDAVLLALHGDDIPRARMLMAEADFRNGFIVTLPMQRFIAAGGTNDDVQRIERRLAQVGIRVEVRD